MKAVWNGTVIAESDDTIVVAVDTPDPFSAGSLERLRALPGAPHIKRPDRRTGPFGFEAMKLRSQLFPYYFSSTIFRVCVKSAASIR